MSSRRYIKRVWRVPKTRGPVEYLATLMVKALRKHGWPADWQPAAYDPQAFYILHDQFRHDLPPDFSRAVGIAARVLAAAYRVDVTETDGHVQLNRRYRVTDPGGHFREVKNEPDDVPHACTGTEDETGESGLPD